MSLSTSFTAQVLKQLKLNDKRQLKDLFPKVEFDRVEYMALSAQDLHRFSNTCNRLKQDYVKTWCPTLFFKEWSVMALNLQTSHRFPNSFTKGNKLLDERPHLLHSTTGLFHQLKSVRNTMRGLQGKRLILNCATEDSG